MAVRFLLRMVGLLLLVIGVTMLLPVAVALLYGEPDWPHLLAAAGCSFAAGLALALLFRRQRKEISHREGFAIVTLAWVAAGVAGSLPYWFTGSFGSYIDCLWESVSGFTTTGASIVAPTVRLPRGIESLSHGVLFWRSLTHWLGGMGIILLSIAILPLLGVGGMQLYKAEVPGPISEKVRPRVAETAKMLWYVYALLTVLEVALLMLGGMDWFDAVCHSFGTLATGGFSTRNASIGAYRSVYIEGVVAVFMFLAGVNFALHYLALAGRPRAYLKNPEFRVYTAITVVAIAAFTVGLSVTRYPGDLARSFRYAMFQVPTILTTTGYGTDDFERWPAWMMLVLLGFMFVGGCAGSTGGGIKVMRIQLLVKSGYTELFQLIHPHAVKPVHLGRRAVPPEVLRGIWNFFFLYVAVFAGCAVLLAWMGQDMVTAFSAVAACIGNIGPGLGTVGPTDNYAHIPTLGKLILILCMLLGRLEVYTVLVLLVPAFWRK